MQTAVDVAGSPDPVAAVLAAADRGGLLALRTSGTTSRPRVVVRTAASWTDSFPHVSQLAGIDAASRVWVPGPLAATMNLFAAVHTRAVGARAVPSAAEATHAVLTPSALVTALRDGTELRDRTVVVAGDRLSASLAARARAAGARVEHYYGAAELSFVAWGTDEDELRPFPEVELDVSAGLIRVRSPWLAQGYAHGEAHGEAHGDGPFTRDSDGFAMVGDRGVLDAGRLRVAGRGSAAVVTGGATVLVDDVEAVLRRATGAEVWVVGVPHPRLGELVAAVLPDAALLGPARRAARTQLLPAQRPRRWLVVPELPLTAAGKVDRTALAEQARDER